MVDQVEAPLPGTFSRILREPRAVAGGLFIAFLIGCAVFAPLIAPHDPFTAFDFVELSVRQIHVSGLAAPGAGTEG